MENILIIINCLIILLFIGVCIACYMFGFIKGFKKCKEIDDEIFGINKKTTINI